MKVKYLPSGYIDMPDIIENNYPFCFVVGARGTGKTYGALQYAYQHPDQRFILMRRTQDQADIIGRDETCPFKAVTEDLEAEAVKCDKVVKTVTGYYLAGDLIGYGVGLTTFANIRGVDFRDVQVIYYDEFIKERHQRKITAEGMAFLNMVETVNRNRELQGRPPVKVVCMANSDDIANPLFIELGLVTTAEKMLKKGQEVYTDPKRGIYLAILKHSRISQQKENTALYKLVNQQSDFFKMAISNDFNIDDDIVIKSRPLIEYVPKYQIGECCIYKHKSGSGYYVSSHIQGKPVVYGAGEMEKTRFCRQHPEVWDAYMRREIIFESYLLVRIFESYYLK